MADCDESKIEKTLFQEALRQRDSAVKKASCPIFYGCQTARVRDVYIQVD